MCTFPNLHRYLRIWLVPIFALLGAKWPTAYIKDNLKVKYSPQYLQLFTHSISSSPYLQTSLARMNPSYLETIILVLLIFSLKKCPQSVSERCSASVNLPRGNRPVEHNQQIEYQDERGERERDRDRDRERDRQRQTDRQSVRARE